VRVNANIENKERELLLDSILRYTSKDIEKIELAKAMVEHKLIKTSAHEALKSVEMYHWIYLFYGFSHRANANSLRIFKFITDSEWDDESFKIFLNSCGRSKELRKKLLDAEIYI